MIVHRVRRCVELPSLDPHLRSTSSPHRNSGYRFRNSPPSLFLESVAEMLRNDLAYTLSIVRDCSSQSFSETCSSASGLDFCIMHKESIQIYPILSRRLAKSMASRNVLGNLRISMPSSFKVFSFCAVSLRKPCLGAPQQCESVTYRSSSSPFNAEKLASPSMSLIFTLSTSLISDRIFSPSVSRSPNFFKLVRSSNLFGYHCSSESIQ